MTTVYFPGVIEGYRIIPEFPNYAISESGDIRALGNTNRTTAEERIVSTNGCVFLYLFDGSAKWNHRIVMSVAQLLKDVYSDGKGAGVAVPEKRKVTIEIEDPEMALRILKRLVVSDYTTNSPSINQCYSWIAKTEDALREAMKDDE